MSHPARGPSAFERHPRRAEEREPLDELAANLLAHLPFSPLCVRLRMDSEWLGSEFKGSRLRGGLGTFLRAMVCTEARSECGGCQQLADCAYGVVFETPVDATRFPVLRRYEKAPHAFTVAAPLDRRRRLAPGELLEFGLTIIGIGHGSLPTMIEALNRMGQSGDYGGRFHVESVSSAQRRARVLFEDGDPGLRQPEALFQPVVRQWRCGRVALAFEWPLRLVTERVFNSAPRLDEIVLSLAHRMFLLASLYGGYSEPFENLYPFVEAARTVRHLEVAWRWTPLERESRRQDRKLPLDGVTGRLAAEGVPSGLVQLLEAGQWLQLGKSTSQGLGAYQMELVRL